MGTKLNNYGELVTNGGRVLIVVTTHQDLVLAAARATMACGRITFNGAQFRTDIAHRGIARYDLLQISNIVYYLFVIILFLFFIVEQYLLKVLQRTSLVV